MKFSVGSWVPARGYEILVDGDRVMYVNASTRSQSYDLAERIVDLIENDSEVESILSEEGRHASE